MRAPEAAAAFLGHFGGVAFDPKRDGERAHAASGGVKEPMNEFWSLDR